jgi:hypothetical protein
MIVSMLLLRGQDIAGVAIESQDGFAGRLVRQQSWQEIVNESLILIRNGESIRPRVMRYTP